MLAENRVRLIDHARHVDLLVEDGEAPRFELGEVEHLSDESLEARALGRDHVERGRPRVGILDEPLAESLDVPADGRQRRAELV